jgi:hypothetical protein
MRRIDRSDLNHRRNQEAFDLLHRLDETAALSFVEWFKQRLGELVASSVEKVTLRSPGGCEVRDTNPLIGRFGINRDEPGGVESAEHATEIPGVEVEPGTEGAHVTTIVADLPEHAGLTEGAIAGEEPIVESTDALGDEPVEPSYLGDSRCVHALRPPTSSIAHSIL